MSGFQITITDAGRAEIINAENTGTAPVLISEIGVGTGQYEPNPGQLSLQNEIKRIQTFGGSVVSDDTISITARDDGNQAYSVYEFGLYTETGTLFAVYSQEGSPVVTKTATSIMLLTADIILISVNAGSVTFGDFVFTNPPATESVRGSVFLATQEHVNAGTEDTRAVTSKKLQQKLNSQYGYSSKAAAEDGLLLDRVMSPRRSHEAFGQFGLGYVKVFSDANLAVKGGLYSLPASEGALNAPIAGTSGTLLVITGGASTNHISQQWSSSNDTASNRIFTRHKQGSGPWTAWVEHYHSGNLQLVNQSESELGASSTARLWSSQRVRQNAVAYAVTQGLGVTGNAPINPDLFNLDGVGSGLFRWNNTVSNRPSQADGNGVYLFLRRSGEGGPNDGAIIAVDTPVNGNNARAYVAASRSGTPVFHELFTTGRESVLLRKDYRTTLVGGNSNLSANTKYHIASDSIYTLPPVSGLASGTTIKISKSVYNTPTIQVHGGSGENIRIGRTSGTPLADTSILFDINSEIILVWNGTAWEV